MKRITRCLSVVLLLATTVARAQVFNTVYNFTALVSGTNRDGAEYLSSLLLARDGNLYGTAYYGGTNGTGTIFRFSPGHGFDIVHTFSAMPNGTNSDGAHPYAGLIQDTDGNYYGTTAGGGAHDFGTVFQMTANGAITLLHSFNYSDGENPKASLTPAGGGTYYGAALAGGANGTGDIFLVNTNGTFQDLYDFAPGNLNASFVPTNFDGSGPFGTLVPGGDGYVYGTTHYGGTNGNGTIFRFNTNNSHFDLLHTFGATDINNHNPDGANPYSSLTPVTNGVFWGTATYAGTNGGGTIFQVTTGGVFSVVHTFNSLIDGSSPYGTLVRGHDGNLYGTTDTNSSGYGTLFQITTSGTLATLHIFSPQGGDGSDGSSPFAGVTFGNDGYIYGTTSGNGANTNGTIYQVIYPVLINPVLTIASLPGNQVLISWPTNQAGFTLQVNTNLLATNWITATPAPSTNNDQFVVTNNATGTNAFYRLKK